MLEEGPLLPVRAAEPSSGADGRGRGGGRGGGGGNGCGMLGGSTGGEGFAGGDGGGEGGGGDGASIAVAARRTAPTLSTLRPRSDDRSVGEELLSALAPSAALCSDGKTTVYVMTTLAGATLSTMSSGRTPRRAARRSLNAAASKEATSPATVMLPVTARCWYSPPGLSGDGDGGGGDGGGGDGGDGGSGGGGVSGGRKVMGTLACISLSVIAVRRDCSAPIWQLRQRYSELR